MVLPSFENMVTSSSLTFMVSQTSARQPRKSYPVFIYTVTTWCFDSWRSFTGAPIIDIIMFYEFIRDDPSYSFLQILRFANQQIVDLIKEEMNNLQTTRNGFIKKCKRQSTLSCKNKATILVNAANRNVSQQKLEYINNMKKFFTTIEKSKLRRVIEQVCSINSTFQSYIKNLPNQVLTLAQTLDFQQKYRRNSALNRSKNYSNNYSKIDTQAQNFFEINSGYRLLYRKLLDYQFIQFQNQIKYMRQILAREAGKLQNYDQAYVAEKLVKSQNINVSKLLFSGENQIGFVKFVKKQTRQKLNNIDDLSKCFAQMV